MDSSSKDDRKYDVYLSSGGEDIRRTFTDHLYYSLKGHLFNVFMYGDEIDYKLEKSNGALPEHLIQEIERSKVAVVVFSSGYLRSEWCLEELVKIMECRNRLGQMFFPILYDVDLLDVGDQIASFPQKFQKVEFGKMRRHWAYNLKEAVSLAELNLRKTDDGHEGNFIRNVIAHITGKLSCTTCSEVASSLVGIDSRVREISKHLDVGGSNDVRIIGILGMCGLGKTTVAKAVFNKHHHSFDGASFLQNVREKKLVDLQEQLLSDILKWAYIVESTMDEGTEEIEQLLRNRRVLVVIDGVDSVEQLDAWAIKPDSLGPGSRIIITSRNEHLLKILNVGKICPLPAMNERRALELLSWHAFGKIYPNEEYVELSRKAVGYCGGLPLALEILGSYLCAKSTSEWETVLDKWKRSQPYQEIHRRLKISFDGLTDDDVKAIFLDISCFFTGMKEDYVMTVLDGCQFYPEIGIQELQDQCLVTVDKEGYLTMHDLIQGMGREIVRAESPDHPGERSRLWHNEDIMDVLTKQSGTEDIEGLALDMQESDECSFSTEAFRKMQSLRLLKLNNIKLYGSYDNLSKELRWLCWHGFPLKVIPEDFDQSNLVAIDLSYSKLIRVWVDTDVLLKNLKIINLSHSHYLTESPDLSKVPNLEKLILVNCVRLSKIHPSIGHLERLSLVNLEDCKTLQYLPGDFCKSKSVETLILKGCTGFIKLKDKGVMVSSTKLQASHTMTMKLPSSIAGLKNLRSVLLSLHGLSSLTLLGLGNCGLTDDAIPKDLGSLFSLEILELDGNLFYSLPSLSGLSKLKMLDLSYCKNLLEIPDLPRSLEILRANQCIALAKLPNFSEMSSMVELHLNHSPKLTEILGLHKSLNTMRRIHMEGCTNLTADFRKNIVQGWTSCGHGDIFLNGIYDIPEWFQIVGIHEPNDVRFKVPRNFRGLTVCCVFETYCPGFTVTNITKRKALHTWEESTCGVADSVLRLQSVLSNDVLHLQSGDEVSISAVTKAHGRGRVIGRVMKTGVNLVWDDGNAGDKYTSIEEIGAVPRNKSSEETLPSPSVHTDGCSPMASDLEKCANEALIDDCFKLAVDLYTHAIAFNPQSAELYTNRAQANIKSGNLTEAVADANKAIEFDPLLYKAYLRKGIACIKLKEYQTAKATLEIGAPLAPHETRFANLIKECDEKIAEETAVLPTASLENNITENVIPAKDVQPASQPSNQVTIASVKPKYRPEFYQKPEEVVVTIFAEGIPAKDVNVDFGEQKLGVSIDVAGEDTYYFQTRLFGKIIPEMCRFDVLSTKVEIRLAKAEPLHWTSLEFSEDNPVPLKVTGPVLGVPSPSYLSSKPRTNPVTVHPMPSNDANQPDGFKLDKIGEQMGNLGSKYDVFLSFRGKIRKGFTDHFYLRLKDYEFNVFLDEDGLTGGDPITEKLKQAIKKSRLAVIMFSKGYAESRWCLEELVEIMECRKTKGQFVFPIFYDVDPSDVRHQKGSFATAFQNHEQKFTKEKVLEWRTALTAAADLSGEPFQVNNGREARFIRKVVEEIAIKLQNGWLNVAANPVGIDSRHQKVSKYLDVGGSNVVRIIGIWGMCGLGKSTIAKAIFNTYQDRFDGACFLENVRNEKMVDLQNILLSKILRSANINVSTVNEGTEEIKTRLRNLRVLVIIDDVDSVRQINALAIKHDSFGLGSRIVITTRDKNLLKTPEVVDDACSLPTMHNNEALELLSWHAFGKPSPNEGYLKVSREAVDYCGGLPLALEAVGSYLCTKTTSEWTDALKKWKTLQPSITHKIFKVSYDGLTDDKVKDIFLDISCFFIGMNKHHVMAILDGCDSNPAIGIKELEERCLVTVDPKGNLMMHCLIRDTGREIVRAKSPKKLESRCRLWHHEDVKHVLTKKCEKKKIEGIALDFSEPDKLSVSTEAFRMMLNLRLLKIRGVKFTGDCKHLPEELRWLSLSDFPLQAIPEDFNQPNVVDVDLSYSNIKVWNDNVSLEKLKFLNLGYCDHLKQSPDFSRIPNIEILILEACKSLSEIHHSVVQLKNLKYLSVAKCKNLQEIPDLPTNLEILKADECIALKKMPDFSEMSSMVELHLNHSPKLTKILGLHKSLNTMRRIHMEGCTNLTAAFRKAILQGWSASRNGDLFCPGNDLLSGFTCVDPKDEIVSALFIPGNDLPSGFTCVDPKKEIVVPHCFGDDAKALTLCIVYSCNDSQSSDSLCISVENRTKETEIYSSSPMFATVLNGHESNIWLGHLSNNTLNVNGGDKINVGAEFVGHGSTGDIHLRVQKIGVYLELENVVDEFSNPMTLSSEYDQEVNLMQDEVRLLSEEKLSRKRQRYDKDVNLMQDQVRLSSEENRSRKRRGYDKDVNLTQDQVRLSYEESRSRKRL